MSSNWKKPPRYHPFSRFLRATLGADVRRVTVNGGFGCPNRDGTIGVGGCTFCVNPSFSPVAEEETLSLREQVTGALARARERGYSGRFFVYFQPFTNTHADVATLRRRYDEALCDDGIVGLAVGTRPDCVPEEVLVCVQSYTDRYQVWLEYGLQSCHDATLCRVNRGHTWGQFVDAVERTKGRGLLICVHAILGLPGETREHMRQTAERVAGLGIDGIKLRQLAIVKGAQMEAEHQRGEIATLTSEEYVSFAADFLERLPASVVIQRLVGDTPGDLLLAPKWEETKSQVLSAITNELRSRGTWQGALHAG
jgi:radical SAM protein (TIGR01212 family)